MRSFWILMFLVLVAGCSKNTDQAGAIGKTSTIVKRPVMQGTFDPAAAAYVLKPGAATIKGEISAEGRDGRSRKGRGARVVLIPQTSYAGEYIEKLFRGRNVYRWGATVLNLDRKFSKYMRHAVADGQGNYTFFGVPQGAYYVYAKAPLPSDYFAIYKRVTIAKGQTVNLPLNDK